MSSYMDVVMEYLFIEFRCVYKLSKAIIDTVGISKQIHGPNIIHKEKTVEKCC